MKPEQLHNCVQPFAHLLNKRVIINDYYPDGNLHQTVGWLTKLYEVHGSMSFIPFARVEDGDWSMEINLTQVRSIGLSERQHASF